MKPLGRFFQVTETLDFKKYFLDIEKIERYPLSFVVKSEESIDELLAKIKADALKTYVVQKVVDDYLSCIEEVINIPVLKSYLYDLEQKSIVPFFVFVFQINNLSAKRCLWLEYVGI